MSVRWSGHKGRLCLGVSPFPWVQVIKRKLRVPDPPVPSWVKVKGWEAILYYITLYIYTVPKGTVLSEICWNEYERSDLFLVSPSPFACWCLIFPSAHFPSTGHKIILMEEKDYHKVCVKMVKRNKGEGGWERETERGRYLWLLPAWGRCYYAQT